MSWYFNRLDFRVSNILCKVISFISSWLGKTHFIKRAVTEARLERRILLICDEVDRTEIVRMLHQPALDPEKEALHLIIGKVVDWSELNLFLFELLVLRVVFAGSEVAFLPSELRVFIELESVIDLIGVRSIGNLDVGQGGRCKMLDALPFVTHFPRQHLIYDAETLEVPVNDPKSSISVVAHYLHALHEDTIDTQEVNLTAEPIAPVECRRLLNDYFLDGESVKSPSMRLLDTFVRVLANQLQHLSNSPFLNVDSLNSMSVDTSKTRTILVNALIDVSRDFALRSIATNDESTDYVEYMNTMKKWTDSNHLLVLYLTIVRVFLTVI